MTADERFLALGKEVPPLAVPPPNLSFRTWRAAGGLVMLSGHGPNGKLMPPQFDFVGRVGQDLSQDEGYQAARLCGLSLLVTLRDAIKSLNHVRQVIEMTGAVNSAPDFTGQSVVINGASDLMVEVFGEEIGKPIRMTFGAIRLPFNMAVEVKMTVEI